MKLSRIIFVIACIIVGVWILGFLLKLAAWLISSLLYIAAIIVIIGLVRYWWESRKGSTSRGKGKIIDAEIVDKK